MKHSETPDLPLKEACLQAAREVIADEGVEHLSMRDVARRLNISHQAPYRHFASRDHLLAEIMRRCFVDFSEHLDGRTLCGDAQADLASMGWAYLDYAARKPLEYRLMFGTPWPEPAQHPELIAEALHAFDLLRNSLRATVPEGAQAAAQIDHQAMFIWSTLHGLASLTQADVMPHLKLAPGAAQGLHTEVMAAIGRALASPANPVTPCTDPSIPSPESSR